MRDTFLIEGSPEYARPKMQHKTSPVIMRFTPTIFLLILGLLLLAGCGRIDNEKIKKSWWKYGSGYHIGDAFRFDDNNLKGDTIYRNDKPIAVITYCGKGMFRNSAILEVESIATGESGTYHDKGPR